MGQPLKERKSIGWVCAEEKSIEKKESPYMVPYNELSEEMKEYDREPIRNIPKILNMVGMKVVRKRLRIVAFKNHDYFINLMKKRGESDFTENFEDLPLEMQHTNFKQSEAIPRILEKIGYRLVSSNDEGIPIMTFSNKEIDQMAKLQHEDWLVDRESDGWKKGSNKDEKEKINPDIKPWNRLSAKMKNINRKVIKKIPYFLKDMDMKIVKK